MSSNLLFPLLNFVCPLSMCIGRMERSCTYNLRTVTSTILTTRNPSLLRSEATSLDRYRSWMRRLVSPLLLCGAEPLALIRFGSWISIGKEPDAVNIWIGQLF
jgi:hypothetical protein